MKNFKLFSTISLFLLTLAGFAQEPCPNGVDIHIANDISGSVDSREFQQSKDFVSLLGANFGNAYGTANTETRVSISNWSAGSGRFVEYDFPDVGKNYAVTISDILSYTTSARPFRGGTDIFTALQKASGWVTQNPVGGRTVPKVIVLLTDSSCGQVSNNISSLATQIKNQGIFIVLLAIDNAKDCNSLKNENVASPGGYFNAQDYQDIQDNAITYINDLRNATCDGIDPEPFDLTVSLSNFEISGCDSTPSASVDYTVTNESFGDGFNDNLKVSFYNGNPTQSSTQYLFTVDAGTQTIPISNGTYNGGTVTDPSLVNNSNLYAVVNFDGAAAGNAVPISLSNLENQINVSGEGQVTNNISSAISRVDTGTCVPTSNINVDVRNTGQVCDNEIIYYVEVCNTGDADGTVTDIVPYPPTDFSLEAGPVLVGSDPFVGDILPAGECVIYEYTYGLSGASNGITYDFSVAVEDAPPCDNDISVGTGAIVDMMYDYNGDGVAEYSWCAREVIADGKVWLDRNLGAYRVATAEFDKQSYGDLYQWGRAMDGHQKQVQRSGFPVEEGNGTQGVMVNGTTTTNSSSDSPGNALFIIESNSPLDWRIPKKDALWNNSINNPCPVGYRLPNEQEANGQFNDWNFTSFGSYYNAAFNSPLKLSVGGRRYSTTGTTSYFTGYFWTKEVTGDKSEVFEWEDIGGGLATTFAIGRANGIPVRCIKD